MINLISFISLIFINIIIYYCLYFDIKYRIIPNKFFFFIFIISLFLNLINMICFYKKIGFILVTRIFSLIQAFLFSFFLFCIKIIGGSDGKLVIFIFTTEPLYNFHFSHGYTYFSIFCALYLASFIINYGFNCKARYIESFNLFYDICWNNSYLKKAFFKSSYKFINFSELRKLESEKFELKSIFLFYNTKLAEFHILVQIRKPITLICIGSYYFLILFKYFY